MINIEAEVFSPIYDAVTTAYPTAFVTSEYVRDPASFPHVSIVETDNYMTPGRLDTSDYERYSTITYEINVYSNKTSGKKSECRDIMMMIDRMMYDHNFVRLSMTPVPNLEDATIYRIVARYRAETDGARLYRP